MNLAGLEISNLHLAVKTSATRQCNMKQNRPVAAHGKVQRALVTAWDSLLDFAKGGSHPGMRHVAFEHNARSGNGHAGSLRQGNRENVGA